MKKRLVYILFIVFVSVLGAKGQQFPLTTQYLFNPYALNPAFAGYYGKPEVYLNFRKDWTGITGSPKTFRANGYGNIYKDVMWLGGEIYSDKADVLNRFKMNLSYSYILQVQEEQYLYFGVWTSFYQNSVNLANLTGVDPNDPLIANRSKLNGAAFNAGFGINYNWRELNIGFAFPTLFSTKEEYVSTVNFKMQREFLFHVSNMFRLNDKWQLQVFSVFRKTKNQPMNAEFSVMPVYMQRFWGGMLFRTGGVLALNAGGMIYKGLVFNYSYEIGLTGINNGSGGAHEITVGYRFNMDNDAFFNRIKGKKTYRKGKKRPRNYYGYPEIMDYSWNKNK